MTRGGPVSLKRGVTGLLVAQIVVGVTLASRDASLERRFSFTSELDSVTVTFAALSLVGSNLRSAFTAIGTVQLASVQFSETSYRRFLHRSIRIGTLAAILVAVIMMMAVLLDFRPGLNELSTSTLALLSLATVGVVTQSTLGAIGARLFAKGQYFLVTTLSSLPHLAVIVLLQTHSEPSIAQVSFAMSSGYCLELLVANRLARADNPTTDRRPLDEATSSPDRAEPSWTRPGGSPSIIAFSSMIFASLPLVDQVAATLIGQGEASRLLIASRVPIGLSSLLASALAAPVLSRASLLVQEGNTRRAILFIRSAALKSALFCSVATVILFTLSDPVARLFVSRDESVNSVSHIQTLLFLGFAPSVAGTILSRAFYVLGRSASLVLIASLSVATKLLLNSALSPSLGTPGLALATSITMCTSVLLSFLLVRRFLRTSELAENQ